MWISGVGKESCLVDYIIMEMSLVSQLEYFINHLFVISIRNFITGNKKPSLCVVTFLGFYKVREPELLDRLYICKVRELELLDWSYICKVREMELLGRSYVLIELVTFKPRRVRSSQLYLWKGKKILLTKICFSILKTTKGIIFLVVSPF